MSCPTNRALREWLEGLAVGDAAARVAAHAGGCADCARRACLLARTTLARLRAATTVPERGETTEVDGAAGVGASARAGLASPTFIVDEEVVDGGPGLRALDAALGRTVALKRLGDGEERGAFEREVRITARLQHPGLPAVYQAGELPTGEPYFAMRPVRGRRLADAIADAGAVERLALLPRALAAVEAVAHAHRGGVTHRALSAERTLLGEHGETVVVDWSHATEPDDPDGDPRDDVAALGNLLYHLVTGAPPAGTPLREAAPGVPPDLATVIETARAADPADRYADAEGLADDLRAFLAGRMVTAHHYSGWQRVARFVARHRAAVAVGAIALALLVATAATGLWRVVHERDRAQRQRAAADALVEFMLFDLYDRLESIGKLDLLQGVAGRIDDYYGTVRTVDPDALLRRGRAAAILGDAARARGDVAAARRHHQASLAMRQQAARIRPGVEDPIDDVGKSQHNLARVEREAGDLAAARTQAQLGIDLLEPAVEAHPGWRSAHATLGALWAFVGDIDSDQGDADAAAAAYREALGLYARLDAELPGNAGLLSRLTGTYHRLGLLERRRRDFPAARAAFRAALSLRIRAAVLAPGDHDRQREVGITWMAAAETERQAGDPASALLMTRMACAHLEPLVERDPANSIWIHDLLTCRIAEGDAAESVGDLQGAMVAQRAALAAAERLAHRDPQLTRWDNALAATHERIGILASKLEDYPTAEAELRAALAITEGLAARDPTNVPWAASVASVHSDLGDLAVARGRDAQALVEYRAALAIHSQLARRRADPGAISEIALQLGNIGLILVERPISAAAGRCHIDLAIVLLEALSAARLADNDDAAALVLLREARGDGAPPGAPR